MVGLSGVQTMFKPEILEVLLEAVYAVVVVLILMASGTAIFLAAGPTMGWLTGAN